MATFVKDEPEPFFPYLLLLLPSVPVKAHVGTNLGPVVVLGVGHGSAVGGGVDCGGQDGGDRGLEEVRVGGQRLHEEVRGCLAHAIPQHARSRT